MREHGDKHHHPRERQQLGCSRHLRLDDEQGQQQRGEATRPKPGDEGARHRAHPRTQQGRTQRRRAHHDDGDDGEQQRQAERNGAEEGAEHGAEEDEGEQHGHLGRHLAVLPEAVAEGDVEERDRQARKEGGEEAVAPDGLRG